MSEGHLESNMNGRMSEEPLGRASSVHVPGTGAVSENGHH